MNSPILTWKRNSRGYLFAFLGSICIGSVWFNGVDSRITGWNYKGYCKLPGTGGDIKGKTEDEAKEEMQKSTNEFFELIK